MGRRLRASAPQKPGARRRNEPVEVKRSTRKGWTLAQAMHAYRQGYSAEQVERLSGWSARAIEHVALEEDK